MLICIFHMKLLVGPFFLIKKIVIVSSINTQEKKRKVETVREIQLEKKDLFLKPRGKIFYKYLPEIRKITNCVISYLR